ncbi:hypothetical protein OIV83_006122 [Microbotryomycetes sp. JL201]|nr:hypothetical protein OIV83_006122 [Microbotryomycetes sp. JL201]
MGSKSHSAAAQSDSLLSPDHIMSSPDVFPLLHSLKSRPEFQHLASENQQCVTDHLELVNPARSKLSKSKVLATTEPGLAALNQSLSPGRASVRPRDAAMLINDLYGNDVVRALEQGHRAEFVQQRLRSTAKQVQRRHCLPTVNEMSVSTTSHQRPLSSAGYHESLQPLQQGFMASQSTSDLPQTKSRSLSKLTRTWSARSTRSSTSSQTWKRTSTRTSSDVGMGSWLEIGSPTSVSESEQQHPSSDPAAPLTLDLDRPHQNHPQLATVFRLDMARPTRMYESYSRDESVGAEISKHVTRNGYSQREKSQEFGWWRRMKRALTK